MTGTTPTPLVAWLEEITLAGTSEKRDHCRAARELENFTPTERTSWKPGQQPS